MQCHWQDADLAWWHFGAENYCWNEWNKKETALQWPWNSINCLRCIFPASRWIQQKWDGNGAEMALKQRGNCMIAFSMGLKRGESETALKWRWNGAETARKLHDCIFLNAAVLQKEKQVRKRRWNGAEMALKQRGNCMIGFQKISVWNGAEMALKQRGNCMIGFTVFGQSRGFKNRFSVVGLSF